MSAANRDRPWSETAIGETTQRQNAAGRRNPGISAKHLERPGFFFFFFSPIRAQPESGKSGRNSKTLVRHSVQDMNRMNGRARDRR